MAMRYRKSINLGGGFRVNLNKKSVGLSAGGKGFRYSANTSGGRNRTISAPGTGLSWRTTTSRRSTSRAESRPTTSRPVAAAAPRPRLFAPKVDKQLFKALQQAESAAPAEYWAPVMLGLTGDPRVGVAASMLAGLLLRDRDPQTALRVLSPLLAAGVNPGADRFLARYCPRASGSIAIDGVPLTLAMSRDLLAVMTSQLHSQGGQLPAARSAADAMSDSAWARALRADLAVEAGDFNAAIALTDNLTNADDLAALALAIRGAALRQVGHVTAAQEALREALRFPSRAATVRHRARLERARLHVTQGQPAKAQQDLERILAEDSQYPGVRELLATI